MHHYDWFHNQGESRKKRRERAGISLINEKLKSLLKRAQSFIDRDDFAEEANKAEHVVQQSSIWDVGYINNMENERVAVEQAVLLKAIFKREGDNIPHSKEMDSEVDYFMRQLGNYAVGVNTSYNERLKGL